MKGALKYLGAGILGTLIIGVVCAIAITAPVSVTALGGVVTVILSVAIVLLPGALLVYGLVYLHKKKKS